MEILALGQRVRCHKNLHRGDWSISVKGKVVAHVPEIVLANVTFKIRETARQRVIARSAARFIAGLRARLRSPIPPASRPCQ